MKRTTFLTLISAVGAVAATPGSLLARERIARVEVLARGDRQWMLGRPGGCAFATAQDLKWGGYTLEHVLS